MSRSKNTNRLVYLGISLLAFASLFHLFEHWETSVLDRCVSECEQSHAAPESSQEAPSHAGHAHGCAPHDHSPAVLQSALLFLPLPLVMASPEEQITAPPPLHREIDQPPRLS